MLSLYITLLWQGFQRHDDPGLHLMIRYTVQPRSPWPSPEAPPQHIMHHCSVKTYAW